MLSDIDTRSVVLTLSAVRLAMLLGLVSYARLYRTYEGFWSWVAGVGAGLLVVGALLLRPVSAGLSVVLTNIVTPLSGLFLLDGTLRFVSGRTLHRNWYLGAILLNSAVSSALFFVWDRLDLRIWMTALVLGALGGVAAWEWLQDCPPRARRLHRATAFLFMGYCALLLARAVAWSLRETGPDMFVQGTPDGLFFLGVGVLDANLMATLLMLNSQRLEEELRDSHERLLRTLEELREQTTQVKILTGILPICSHCKKIRDTEGLWTPVEEYVTHQSEATFSHSLCPSCTGALYPGLLDH